MSYAIHKETYGGQEAYRYQIIDEAGQVRYIAEPTGLTLLMPTRLVTFFDTDHNPVGQLDPPASSPLRWGGTFTLRVGEQESPSAIIEEQWSLVDAILLRLPHYVLHVGREAYLALGQRYGERLYEFYPAPKEEIPSLDAETLQALEDGTLDGDAMQDALEEVDRTNLGDPIGSIARPASGASYVVDVTTAALRQAPLVLAALVIVLDLYLQENPD